MSSPRRRPGMFRPISRGAARAVVFLFVLSFLLAAASSWLSVRAVQGEIRSRASAVQGEIRSRASVVQLCQAGNVARAQQVTLWTHLIQISVPPPHQTPAQKAQRGKLITSFLAYVRHVFARRNCATSFKG